MIYDVIGGWLPGYVEKYTYFEKLERNLVDEFIDFIEIGMTDEKGEREIHIHWKI
mgnify:CR=1 FL=1